MSARKENVLKGLQLLEEYRTRLEGTDDFALQGTLSNAIAAIRSSLFTAVLDIHEALITSVELSKDVQLMKETEQPSKGGPVMMTLSHPPACQDTSETLNSTINSSKESPNKLEQIAKVQRSISYVNALEVHSTSKQDANQNGEKDFLDSTCVVDHTPETHPESQKAPQKAHPESQVTHPESESQKAPQKAHPESQVTHPESESQKAHLESDSQKAHLNTQETRPVSQGTFYRSEEVCQRLQKASNEPEKLTQSKKEEILTIVIDKKSAGLGISISGGVDKPLLSDSTGIYITKILPGTLAAQDGRLRLGDQLLSVNGTSLESIRHKAAVEALKEAKVITLVIKRTEGQNGITAQTPQK